MHHNITLKNLMYICTVRFLKFSHIFKKLQTCVRQQTLNSDQVLQLVKLMIFMSFLPFFLLTSLFYRPHQIQYLTIASSGTVWLLEIHQFKRIQFLAARIAKRSRNLNLLYAYEYLQYICILSFSKKVDFICFNRNPLKIMIM